MERKIPECLRSNGEKTPLGRNCRDALESICGWTPARESIGNVGVELEIIRVLFRPVQALCKLGSGNSSTCENNVNPCLPLEVLCHEKWVE